MELSKQWMSVDVSGWNFLPAYCQWMAVDGSGWQWMAVDGSGCVIVIFAIAAGRQLAG